MGIDIPCMAGWTTIARWDDHRSQALHRMSCTCHELAAPPPSFEIPDPPTPRQSYLWIIMDPFRAFHGNRCPIAAVRRGRRPPPPANARLSGDVSGDLDGTFLLVQHVQVARAGEEVRPNLVGREAKGQSRTHDGFGTGVWRQRTADVSICLGVRGSVWDGLGANAGPRMAGGRSYAKVPSLLSTGKSYDLYKVSRLPCCRHKSRLVEAGEH